jgi:hypothetical protein
MFVYDRAVLDLKYDAFRSALPERFAIYYSIKANPSLVVPIARKRSRSIGAFGILAGIRNPGAPARNTSSFARTLEIPYARKHLRSHLSR